MESWVVTLIVAAAALVLAAVISASRINTLRKTKKYERGLKMVPLLIHLPPATDDIQGNGRDERDIASEAISKAQVTYSILSSTITKGFKARLYGQRHFSFEIIAKDGFIKYYAVVPVVLIETVKQAIQSAYPTARIEAKQEENIFSPNGQIDNISGAELGLNKDFYLPIATYEETKRDAAMGILNALSTVSKDEGAAVQILFRPAQKNWADPGKQYIDNASKGIKTKTIGSNVGQFVMDIIRAPFSVPDEQKKMRPLLKFLVSNKRK